MGGVDGEGDVRVVFRQGGHAGHHHQEREEQSQPFFHESNPFPNDFNNALLSTVTPASETNEVYVALPATAKKTYRFYVKTDNKRHIKNGKAQLVAGKFYQTALTMTEYDPHIDYIIPEDIGSVIGANGSVYANASAAGNAGTTAAAMICVAGYNGHGLAVELNGSPEKLHLSSARNAVQGKTAVAGHGWHLPS